MQSNTFLHRSRSHGSQPIFAIAESGEVSLTTQTCFEIMLPVVEGVVDRDFPQAQFVLKLQALQTGEFRALGMSDGPGRIHPAGEFQQQTAPTLAFIARQPFRHIVRNIQCHLHGRRLPQLSLPRNYPFISLVHGSRHSRIIGTKPA